MEKRGKLIRLQQAARAAVTDRLREPPPPPMPRGTVLRGRGATTTRMQLPRFLLAALTLPIVVTQTPLQTLDAKPQPLTLRLPSRLHGAAEGSSTQHDGRCGARAAVRKGRWHVRGGAAVRWRNAGPRPPMSPPLSHVNISVLARAC